ncbi:AAA family ATPase [Enterocloster sp.]|uniref:AAA family ATPase n=1 Tax=Enterocloster sp. TaxID=2719315 RepID=UPI0030768E6B
MGNERIIIDELDKADATIFSFFYEMLEDGQYTDLVGKVIDLDGYIVIFTANLDSSNFQGMIPEPLFSRFDMTYEFQQLTTEDKKRFVSEFIDVLIAEYEENIGQLNSKNIKNELMKNSYHAYTNVRLIKKDVMNAFVELVDVNNIWNDYTE